MKTHSFFAPVALFAAFMISVGVSHAETSTETRTGFNVGLSNVISATREIQINGQAVAEMEPEIVLGSAPTTQMPLDEVYAPELHGKKKAKDIDYRINNTRTSFPPASEEHAIRLNNNSRIPFGPEYAGYYLRIRFMSLGTGKKDKNGLSKARFRFILGGGIESTEVPYDSIRGGFFIYFPLDKQPAGPISITGELKDVVGDKFTRITFAYILSAKVGKKDKEEIKAVTYTPNFIRYPLPSWIKPGEYDRITTFIAAASSDAQEFVQQEGLEGGFDKKLYYELKKDLKNAAGIGADSQQGTQANYQVIQPPAVTKTAKDAQSDDFEVVEIGGFAKVEYSKSRDFLRVYPKEGVEVELNFESYPAWENGVGKGLNKRPDGFLPFKDRFFPAGSIDPSTGLCLNSKDKVLQLTYRKKAEKGGRGNSQVRLQKIVIQDGVMESFEK